MIDPYLTMRQIADACGWPVQYTRRFLIRGGIAEKNGGDWVVADDRLRERFPAIYERVYAARVLHRDVPQNGARRARRASGRT